MPVQSNQGINRILSELKDQQRINEAALGLLSQRLNVNASVAANNIQALPARSSNMNRIDYAKYLNGPYQNYNMTVDRVPNPNSEDYTAEEIRYLSIKLIKKTFIELILFFSIE